MLKFKLKEISFSVEASIQKTQQWFEAHPKIQSRFEASVNGFDELILAVPSTLDEAYGIIPPWLYLLHEADQELDSTITLIFSGMYKEALRTLRSFVELNLLGTLYFTTKDTDDFKSWLRGEKETPRCKQLVEDLVKKNPNIAKLEQIEWSVSLRILYKKLSQFVHTGGHGGSFQVLRDSNVHMFNERGVEFAVQEFMQAIKLVSAARIACFPLAMCPLPLFEKFGFGGPASGFFEDDQVDRISGIFKEDQKYLQCIKDIAVSDEDINAIVDGILSMPSLSEAEILETLKYWLDTMGNATDREKLVQDLKDKENDVIIAIVKAIQRSFIKASFPLLNECMLGLREADPPA
ncbi:MAG: hypothetical protein WC750_03875 [Patescibacteria group bacterium]|jgi:hypothetical protein